MTRVDHIGALVMPHAMPGSVGKTGSVMSYILAKAVRRVELPPRAALVTAAAIAALFRMRDFFTPPQSIAIDMEMHMGHRRRRGSIGCPAGWPRRAPPG